MSSPISGQSGDPEHLKSGTGRPGSVGFALSSLPKTSQPKTSRSITSARQFRTGGLKTTGLFASLVHCCRSSRPFEPRSPVRRSRLSTPRCLCGRRAGAPRQPRARTAHDRAGSGKEAFGPRYCRPGVLPVNRARRNASAIASPLAEAELLGPARLSAAR